ncbi:MAG TPA: hypothetical protein VMB72_03255, partial [Acidimicrobiales bacterium]|nr:hypothetical protein [Acidimicrobiales bacterium]
ALGDPGAGGAVPAGLEPHTVPELWMMAAPRADRAVDITDTFAAKIAALRQHRSQVGEGEGLEDRLRQWAGASGRQAGMGEGGLAELFQVVPLP